MSSRAYALSRSFPTVLHISDDQSATWTDLTPTGLPTDPSDIKDINVGYYNAYRLLVCGYNGVGVRISNDAGVSFTTVPGSTVFNFDKVIVQDSNLLWAFGDTILRSLDGGVTWINTGVSPVTLYGAPGAKVTAVFVEDGEPATIYIAINEKTFYSNGSINNVWTSIESELQVPAGDVITSIYTNTGQITIVCSNGVYHRTSSLVFPYHTWTSPFILGYSPPYSNYISGISGGGSDIALIDAYGNIYQGTGSGGVWNPIPSSTITYTGTPPLNQRMVRYGNSRLIIYTDSPGKLYESTDNGGTVSLIDSFPGAVIGLTRSINVNCLQCPQKWELYEDDPNLNTCIPTDPPDSATCPNGYTYNSATQQCVSNIDSSTIPAQLPYNTTLCSPINPTLNGGVGGYTCYYTYLINPCGYELTPCSGSSEPILTDTDLSDYLAANQIITIQGSELCYTITQLPDGIYPNYTDVIVDQVFDDCSFCQPKYPLYNCNDISIVIYTQTDVAQYIGQTISVEEYPNECWQVGPEGPFGNQNVIPVTVTNSYETCLECNPIKYQLINCLNNESFIVSDSELADYLGKVIRVEGIPGICFTVETDVCDCVQINTSTGGSYNASTITTINGRNAYVYVIPCLDKPCPPETGTFTILWNPDVSQWQVVSQTGVVLAYNPIDTPCPIGSYWIMSEASPLDDFIITGCYDVIYDITVENSFPNCDYCVNC